MTAPVHLVTSDDDHLLHRAVEQVIDLLHRDHPDLTVESVDVVSADHLPDVRTGTLFGGTRCLLVRGAEGLSGALAEEVRALLEDPPAEVITVLAARGTGRIRAIAKRVGEIGERTEVRTPRSYQQREWAEIVRGEFRRHGREVEPSAVTALLTRSGTDPGTVASMCSQVALAAPPGARIDAGHVAAVTEGYGNQGGFAVADAVADRDPEAALVAVRGALDAGEAPLALLGAVTFRLRQLLRVRGGATAKQAGISDAQHRRLSGIARRSFNPGELAWCHDRAARADLDLKSSDLPDTVVLEVAVVELATSREVGRPWNPLAPAG
jgi:DNA polymerase III subunit delta